ncbi:hypothetical protein LTR36_009374 [Oleoguttula mirabilis]|uniref:Uncharacterized protein n=1 Tax=Oleoguttula mirabilis TaxID=1507867 RepID=A0AAV9JSK5_9PEZI|nr:hypothetical protein LTR36_009374 [Oleoguttula mirabilis]
MAVSVARLPAHLAAEDGVLGLRAVKAASVTTIELPLQLEEVNGRQQSQITTAHKETATKLDLQATHIVSSPYTDFANQLDLRTLDQQTRLFAFALTFLGPLCTDYATAPYMASFNWPAVFYHLRALCAQASIQWERQEFYLVIFRSQLRQGVDRDRLGQLDKESHREACESGGLLKYWFGSCDGDMRNLATCIWRNREDAAAGGRGPWHKKARNAAREMYESIFFYTHKLVVEAGATEWRLEEYVE